MKGCIDLRYTNDQVIELLADLIGQTFTDAHICLVEERTQRPARPSGPNYATTKDYMPDRVNLILDENDCILRFEFN